LGKSKILVASRGGGGSSVLNTIDERAKKGDGGGKMRALSKMGNIRRKEKKNRIHAEGPAPIP